LQIDTVPIYVILGYGVEVYGIIFDDDVIVVFLFLVEFINKYVKINTSPTKTITMRIQRIKSIIDMFFITGNI